MRDDMSVTDLVTRARIGDQQAWDALVERYTPLAWSVCRQYWLGITDAQDVGQTVWLRLVDQLGNLRDPAALAGWLATTTRRECIRVLGAAERPALAFRDPPRDCQRLLGLLDRRSSAVVRPDKRHAGHPGRQHRAQPWALPGQITPPPGRRCPNQA